MYLSGFKRTIQVHKPRKELVVPDPDEATIIEHIRADLVEEEVSEQSLPTPA